jgi:hypothetical protein
LHHRDDLSISEPTDTVLISDSGCDQSIINNKAFYIFSRSGKYFHVDGALADRMTTSDALQVVNGMTLITTKNGENIYFSC